MINLEVERTLPADTWHATLRVGNTDYNAVGGSPGQAVLNSWTSYASHRAAVAWMQANVDRLF